jgi:hypothetical protein
MIPACKRWIRPSLEVDPPSTLHPSGPDAVPKQARHPDSLASAGEWVERRLGGVSSHTRMVWSQLAQTKMRGSSAAEKCYPNVNSTILSRVTRQARDDHSEGQFGGQNAASEG